MGKEVDSAKPLLKGKPTKLSPSCRELAERFIELQLLRQKVRAAECEQGERETASLTSKSMY